MFLDIGFDFCSSEIQNFPSNINNFCSQPLFVLFCFHFFVFSALVIFWSALLFTSFIALIFNCYIVSFLKQEEWHAISITKFHLPEVILLGNVSKHTIVDWPCTAWKLASWNFRIVAGFSCDIQLWLWCQIVSGNLSVCCPPLKPPWSPLEVSWGPLTPLLRGSYPCHS